MKWIGLTPASLALALLLAACGGSGIRIVDGGVADNADYTIDRVMILAPPAQPGAGEITVRIVYTLHQSGGNVAPNVRLFDDDNVFRFGDDVVARGQFVEGAHGLAPGQHDGTITYGGYSDHVVVSDRFVVKVPDGMDPANAAPMLCAGITTYSPLKHVGVKKGERVVFLHTGGAVALFGYLSTFEKG